MSDENGDLEAGSGFQPDLERVDKPTIIELDSLDSQDFSEPNDTAKAQQYEAPASFHVADHEPENSAYRAKRLSPQRSGALKKESSKSDHEVKNYESVVRGRDGIDRRREGSDRWGLSSGANEERLDIDGSPPRGGQNSLPYHGQHEEKPSPRRHRSPKETTISNQIATREPGMSRDSESEGKCEMQSSAVTSSESKRRADQGPAHSSGSPPSHDMDGRRGRTSRSISPRGDRGRLHRNRNQSRSRSRSRCRSRSPYYSRHSDRKPPAGQVCRDFLAGRCRRGPQCRFSHQDSTSYSRYSSPLEYPKEGGREKDRDREKERDRDRERERDRDREKEIGWDRDRYSTRNDRENFYDSRGQTEYSRDIQSSQGYRSNYDEPSYHSNSNQSSERCLDFSKGRCTRGENCWFVHHKESSGHGGWGMRDVETKRGWDERERDGVSRSRVATFDDQENNISLESGRDKRAKGNEICSFFLEGRCDRGQGCRFSHEVGHGVHGEDANEQSWSNKMQDAMHSRGGTLNAYAIQPQATNLSYTGQAQVPQQPLLSFYPANQNPVNPNPVNPSLVNTNPITGGITTTVLGSVLGHPTVNSYTSVSSNPNHKISGYNLHGQTMRAPDNIMQSMLGPNPDQSSPPPPPPPVNLPNPNPGNMLTSEQAANIDVKAYLSQILANNPGESTSMPSIPAAAQPGKNPAPHESPVTPPVERNPQEVQKEEDGLGHKPKRRSTPNPKLSKETKGVKLFKCALVEVVKDLLKPSWKEGQLSREAHKTIVKKVVDKVTGTMEEGTIPQTQEKIDMYLSQSKSKLSKLVQAYVGKYVKPAGN